MAKGKIEQEVALKVTGLDDVKEAGEVVDDLDGKTAKAKVETAVSGLDDVKEAGDVVGDLDGKTAHAKVEASVSGLDDVKGAGDAIGDLDGKTAQAKVEADTGTVTRDLQSVFELVDKLGSTSASIILKDNAKDIEREIASLVLKLDGLEDEHDIKVTMDQINALESQIGQVDAKLAELGDRPIDLQTGNARKGLDDIGKSAASSKSVLANMVGNATQDLGALGGVAGSAGVAIGQMGEYMVDAKADGDKLGQLLTNFGKVAGPIALISLALKAAADVMGRFNDSAERTADSVDVFAGALKSGESTVDAYKASVEDMNGVILDTVRNQSSLVNTVGEIDSHWYSTGIGIHLLADALGVADDETKNITPTLNKAGISLDQFATASSAVGQSAPVEFKKIADALSHTTLTADEQADILTKLTNNQTDAATAAHNHGEVQKFLGTETASVRDVMLQAAIAERARVDALDALAAASGRTAEEMAASAEATAEMNTAMTANKIAVADAQGALNDFASAFGQMTFDKDAISKVFDIHNAAADAQTDLRNISVEIDGLSEAAEGVEVGDILAGNIQADKFLDAIEGLKPQIQTAVMDSFASGGPEAATKLADDFVEKIYTELGGKLSRDQIRQLIGLDNLQATFNLAVEVSMADKARTMLNILEGLQGGVTTATANLRLGLDTGSIDPEQVVTEVELLLAGYGVGIPANVQTPEAASILSAVADAQSVVDGHPVVADLDVDPTMAYDATASWATKADNTLGTSMLDANGMPADAVLEGWTTAADGTTGTPTLDADPVTAYAETHGWKTDADTTSAESTLYADPISAYATTHAWQTATDSTTATATANAKLGTYPSGADIVRAIGPVTVQVQAKLSKISGSLFADGGTAADGGLAGEAGAEFVRYPDGRKELLTGPTIVPPGTHVTSVRRTRQILGRSSSRTTIPRELRGLPRYANGGTVTAIQPVAVTINTAVIGNPFEVDRAVTKALRRFQRLNGVRA